jgi:hypothetical protein
MPLLFLQETLLWHVWLAKFSRIRVGRLVQIHMTRPLGTKF